MTNLAQHHRWNDQAVYESQPKGFTSDIKEVLSHSVTLLMSKSTLRRMKPQISRKVKRSSMVLKLENTNMDYKRQVWRTRVKIQEEKLWEKLKTYSANHKHLLEISVSLSFF